MGFELDRLMKQFGVATPSLNYSGTGVPIDPGTRPVATDTLTGDDLTKSQANYDNLLAKYNLDKANYPADQALYNTYKTEYQNRLLGTPQYMQAQFQTGNEPKSAGLQWATRPDVNVATGSGMGVKQFNKNITDFATQNPTANTAAINAQADKAGVSGQDIFNATNNRWGNTLQAPKYGTLPPAVVVPPTVSPLTQISGGGNTPIAQESFDSDAYLAANPDVASELNRGVANFGDAYGHYLNYGMKEGRQAPMRKATGGQVKTHYNDGGPLQLPSRTVRSSDAFQVMGQPQDPSQFAAADAYNDILRNRVIADTQSGRANDPMYGVADARQLEARANTPERGFGPLVAQRELLNRSNEGEFAAAGYGDLGQFAGSFDPANVPMGDNRYSPVDQARMIARDTSIVDGSASIMPRDGGRAARANLMGDSDDGRYAVSGYGDLGQFAGGFGNSGGIGGKYFDDQNMATMAFAHGGPVKTHFQTGGANQTSDIDQMTENYGVAPQPDIMSYQGSKLFPMQGQAPAPVSNQMTRRDAYPPTPQSPMDARASQLDALLQRYAGDSTDYSSELAEARKRSDTESMAFQKMIQEAMKGNADAAPSKAEMYFRLASAFGSPTKTGNFAESLGNVNKELAAYSKDERDAKKAQRALQLQMGLKGQEMRMASAKDELATIKTLASEEMKSKRAITAEVIKDFIKSGEPESAAGKQAKDEGKKPGTKEFQDRVNEIAQTSIDAKLAQVTATLAGMSVQQANANLAIQRFQNLQEQQTKLTPAEVALKTQTEDMLGSTTQAMNDLKRAYELNPNTFDASLPDIAQRKLLETAGSKDPKLANTREQINLLEKGALAQLKSTFPGAISDAETRTLKELQGINAKSIEERGRIMKNAFRALKAIDERSKRRLDEIKRGTYRDTTPTPEGLE